MIAKIFKRFSIVGIFLAMICFAGCLPVGNSQGGKSATDFVGTYTSIYENGRENADTSFDLEIKDDKTFMLKGNGKDVSGTWKSKTVNGDVQVICLPTVEENKCKCEFILTMLDNGTVMAMAGTVDSVFGRSRIDDKYYDYITTVVFEKK